MRKLVLLLTLIAVNLATVSAERRRERPKGIAVAFFDSVRLQDEVGQSTFEDYQFFFDMIREIARRDFPNVEFRILVRGELFRLPDDTGLNVANMRPELGYVLWAPGKKARVLTGVQTDMDFACAAVSFFNRPSSACPK